MNLHNEHRTAEESDITALKEIHGGKGLRLPFRAENAARSHCLIVIVDRPEGPVVLLSEADDNPGASITNSVEKIATEVWKTYFPEHNPCSVRWLEHYPASKNMYAGKEVFDQVTLQWDKTSKRYRNPRWHALRVDTTKSQTAKQQHE